ncbi:DUF115 domain-containing protein [Heliobacterium gestii]|uniref:DUF115 domain-containing protein n=1 Tax=Heliomicrobium gestii TaxID=2699 RepID=A0A845LDN4_HELGE|nr:6-hydroxymethylpterin diphosphokinase MptE-like protein [Heliomicrobium gestii]MBM7866680.1 hypothetical protein [Heliomicrobium gestii]MZP43040.1 DUF115 domain-containing protein [Heliomicrobium gestii]
MPIIDDKSGSSGKQPPVEYWLTNLAALQRHRAPLYRQLDTYARELGLSVENLPQGIFGKTFELLPCRRQGWTLVYKQNEQKAYLHSQYDPLREAADWARSTLAGHNRQQQGNKDHLIVMGIGLGYHVTELVQHKTIEGYIVAVDSSLEHLIAALSVQDWSEALANPSFILAVGPDSKDFSEFLASAISFYEVDSVRIVDYRPVVRLDEAFYQKIIEDVLFVLNQISAELATLMHFSEQWLENIFNNLPVLCRSAGIADFAGKFKGVPAIVVAAGPSLNKVLPELRRWKEKALLFVVGTALKPVMKAGIEPDFIVSIDGGSPNYYHFTDGEANEPLSIKTPLIYDPKVFWHICNIHEGPKIAAVTSDFMGEWLYAFGPYLEQKVAAGPSVTNVAFELARRMGCNPIFLTGLDLCYQTGFTHAEGTAWRKTEAKSERKLLPTVNMFGEPVNTTWAFQIFKDWFEKEIPKTPDVRAYNASVGGLAIEGAPYATNDQIEALLDGAADLSEVREQIRELLATTPPIIDRDRLKADLGGLQEELDRAKKLAQRARDLSKRMGRLYDRKEPGAIERRIGGMLKELETIDEELKGMGNMNVMLALPFQSLYFEYFRRIEVPEDADERATGLKVSEAGRILYDSIVKMAEKYHKMLSKTLERFGEEQSG